MYVTVPCTGYLFRFCVCAIPAPRAPPLAPPLPSARRNLAGSFPLVLKQINGDGKIDIAATTTTGFGALYILFLNSVHNLLSFKKLVPTDGMVGGVVLSLPIRLHCPGCT
jgi:hypothetical protein